MTQVFTDADICVIDDAVTIDEQRQISNQLNSATWRYGWPINDAPFARPCWHAFIAGRQRVERHDSEDELASHPQWLSFGILEEAETRELVFYDHQKENVIKAVLPKPGRIVIFNGHVPHSARSPSVNCDRLRMTLAFKTIV
ncbi:2OG-Fe(II) oxygenase [Pseudomonas sp. 2835]|uniref:2OG-Fe(II) oxygenase n=1 Tax=Pseudomonas sp. 2835 TaxID=3156451 RepID=UPI003D19465E